jgi:lactoylglutathione lyase
MTPRVSGLYEAHLTVSDLQRSVAFYRDVVGLKHAHQIPARGAAFLWIDDRQTGMLGLWSAGHGPQAMRLHLAFRVDLEDVLGAAAVLKARGVTPLGFHGEPSEEPVLIVGCPPSRNIFATPTIT